MKPFLFFISLLLAGALAAQPNVGIAFEYHQLLDSLGSEGGLRKKAVEQIAIVGDGSFTDNDRLLMLLGAFLEPVISAGNRKIHRFSREVKHLTLRNCGWKSLPAALAKFKNLSNISIENCPFLNIQAINDDFRQRSADDPLRKKWLEELHAISFENADFSAIDTFRLAPEIFKALREIRFARIKGLDVQKKGLLSNLKYAYPKIGWLTMEDCGLYSTPQLDTLNCFPYLRSINLSKNFLTRLPLTPDYLVSLDVSHNLISELPSYLFRYKSLDFLFFDCNLFDGPQLMNFRSNFLNGLNMSTLTFSCNRLSEQQAKELANYFDGFHLASYMTASVRYVDDFKPLIPDCAGCMEHRNAFLNNVLQNTEWKASADGTPLFRISMHPFSHKLFMQSMGAEFSDESYEFDMAYCLSPWDQPFGQSFHIGLKMVEISPGKEARFIRFEMLQDSGKMIMIFPDGRQVDFYRHTH